MAIKQRSPNYPSADLGEVLEALKALYPRVQRGEFSPLDAGKAWGYTSVSGPVRRRLAAMRQYGLLEQKRGDNAKLSQRALTLVLRNAASAEYRAAQREAALEPVLIRELVDNEKYLAADDALRQYLIVNRAFTNEGADQFIKVLRGTLAVAGLDDDAKMASQEEAKSASDRTDEDDPMDVPPAPNKFVLSLNGGPAAMRLEFPMPLTEDMWKQLTGMLTAMKPALVQPAASPTPIADVPLPPAPQEHDRAAELTAEAYELIRKLDSSGSVPMYSTTNLARIAQENGVLVSDSTTPNEIIDALREKAGYPPAPVR